VNLDASLRAVILSILQSLQACHYFRKLSVLLLTVDVLAPARLSVMQLLAAI